jgi:hypothetical protein
MKTSIANKIDYLANSNRLNETEMWKLVDELFVRPSDLTDTVNSFLQNLNNHHNIPGKDFEELMGIAHWVDDKGFATTKQKRAVGVLLGIHWNQQVPTNNWTF